MDKKLKNNSRKWFASCAVTVLMSSSFIIPTGMVLAEDSESTKEVVDVSEETTNVDNSLGFENPLTRTSLNMLREVRQNYNSASDSNSGREIIHVNTTRFYANERVYFTHYRADGSVFERSRSVRRTATGSLYPGEATLPLIGGSALLDGYDPLKPETGLDEEFDNNFIRNGDRLVVSLYSSGGKLLDSRTLILEWNDQIEEPSFRGVNDKLINMGDSFDPIEGVSAFDFRKKDITGLIQVSGTVDTTVQGDYKLTYSVTDNLGVSATVIRTITVAEPVEKPVIEGAKDQSITVGDSFDPLEGVSAWDNVDGDITDQIDVSADIDTGTPGTYYISYSVTNSRGGRTVVDTKLIVEEASVITDTTIAPLTTASTTVTGTGEPNGEIRILNGGTVIGTGRVGSDGVYSLMIAPQQLGHTITASVTKGSLISEATTIVTQAGDELVQPILHPMFVDDSFVSGTLGGNARFVAVYVNGVRMRTAAVNADRSFSIYTGDYNLVAGQEIHVAAVTRNGDNGPVIAEGPKASTRIQDRLVSPTISSVFTNDSFVNGTIGGTAKFVGLYINGSLSRTAAVNSDGTYTIYIGDRNLAAGQRIEVAGVTRDGNTGPVVGTGPMTSTTVMNRDNLVAPVINPVFVNDAIVRGTVGGTARFVAIYSNGVRLRTAAVKADRSYEIYVGDHTLVAGQSIQVSSVTRDGDSGPVVAESPKTETRILDRLVTPIINPVHVGDAFVNGSIAGTAEFVGLYINGVLSRTAVVNSNRTYTIYVGDRNLIARQKIEVAGVTRDGNNGPVVGIGPKKETTILNSGQLTSKTTVNPYFETEQFATGTTDANATHVGVFINGELRRAASIDANKSYSIYMADFNLVAGDTFEVASLIRSGTGLVTETGPKTITTVLTKSISINRYVIGQDLVTGKISNGTSRVFLNVDGVQIRRGEVDSDGTFRVWARDVIHSASQKVEIVVVGANGTEIGRFPVNISTNK